MQLLPPIAKNQHLKVEGRTSGGHLQQAKADWGRRLRAPGKSQWYRRARGDNCSNKALPQMSNVSSDKRLVDGGLNKRWLESVLQKRNGSGD